jgi:hypothetical protein
MSTSIPTLPSIDSTSLLNYFNAQNSVAETAVSTSRASSSTSSPTNAADTPPWETPQPANSPARDAQALSTTNYINLDAATLTSGASASTKLEEDNQKLFALYQGVNQLYYLASMSQRSSSTAGQQVGYDTRFQS